MTIPAPVTIEIRYASVARTEAADLSLLGGADAVVVALQSEMIVAFMRYSFEPDPSCVALVERGTWVAPRFRRRGVATTLLNFALARTKADRITMAANTPDGSAYLNAIAKSHLAVVAVTPDDLLKLMSESRHQYQIR